MNEKQTDKLLKELKKLKPDEKVYLYIDTDGNPHLLKDIEDDQI